MIGTILNVTAVLVGSTLGLLVGARIPERMRTTIMQGLGLVVLLIGFDMAFETSNVLIVLGCIALGAITGEWIDIEARLERLGRLIEARSSRLRSGGGKPEHFVRGFVTASLVYCVGPMTIIGSFQDGLTGDFSTLAVKSMLDGISSIVFAASLGVGVLCSALTVLVYQGALTASAGLLRSFVTDPMITEMTAVGGVLIVGIGINLLDLAQIRVANLLPALAFAPLAVAVLSLIGGG